MPRGPLTLVPPPRQSPGGAESVSPSAGALVAGPRAGLELAALGTGLVFTVALMARIGSWSASLGTFQALYGLAFAFFAIALARAGARSVPYAGRLVFIVAVAARLPLLPVTPTLSDDIYRYVWEGKVAAAGGDPYHASPRDPALAPLRDRAIFPRVNHPDLATIYPPLAIAGFALVAKCSPTLWAMKAWVTLHDLALVLLLIAWSRARRGTALPAIAYAWNPLVLVEYAGSGHNDPVAMVWLAAALILAERRPVASALALAVGILTKLAPLVALPFLLRRWTWRARVLGAASIGAGLAAFGFLSRGADSGLIAYARTWANNELAFHYLARAIGDPLEARLAALALGAVVLAALLWRGWETARATRAGLRAGFLLSPVAHPWYLGWVLMFEPLAASAPWLLLSLTAILSYGLFATPAAGGAYHLPLAWRWIEYGAPLALATVLALHSRRGGERDAWRPAT